MNKRLTMLESLTSSGQADAFGWYGLAMEYRREKRFEDALAAFEKLRELHPDYLAMYLMAGQLLLEKSRGSDARVWLEQGLELATKQGNTQAVGELEDALSEC